MCRKISYSIFFFFFTTLLFQCELKPNKKDKSSNFNSIVSNFITPSDSNTVWCYWYWIGDDISKAGITKDLEAMKEVGIGTAFIASINPNEVDGKVPLLSELWWNCMVHAVNEANRIGINIGVFNCPGWSQSGGPWVTPDKAMRHIRYSEANVKGGQKIKMQLEKPNDLFQDIYVLAFPSISKETKKLSLKNATISISPKISNPNYLIDEDVTTDVSFLKSVKTYQFDFSLDSIMTSRSLTFLPTRNTIKAKCDLYDSTNGTLKLIKTFTFDRSKLTPDVGAHIYAPIAVNLPATRSKNFSIRIENIGGDYAWTGTKNEPWGLSEIILSESKTIDHFAEKSLGKMHPTPFPNWDSYSWNSKKEIVDPALKIDTLGIIDISNKMDKQGYLNWDAPQGKWTILRYGMTPTGTKNAPAAPQGKGYEVDKASVELIRFHFKQFIGELIKRVPEESKSALKYVIIDSYEQGSQNWTDDMEKSFQEKYGYNPKKYLPVFSGRIVGSMEESERFLWDLRRCIADDVAYKYCGALREIANENGLKLWLENYGHWGFPSEFMMYGGQSDMVSGEYWNEGTLGNIECKAASSTSHIYGKKITSAECFTAAQRTYVRHPAMLKRRGDWSLTEGINQHVLHLFIHQPDENRIPGVNAWFSTEFNRHNTWFKQSKTYFDYLRRTQHLLQQGNYVADVCYFIGEDVPIMTGPQIPKLPSGYSFDYINAEVIINDLEVKDGTLFLPNGMSYKMMVLPPLKTMRPELLKKLEKLIQNGGIIYGQAPEYSPSLEGFPKCDEQVKTLASKLWKNENKIKKYGKGFVIDGLSLQETLDHFNIKKDVAVNDSVLWTHRKSNYMDIYFLTNQSGKTISVKPSFKIKGCKPQLWDAVTGKARFINNYLEENDRTIIPLDMKVDESCFIVFTNNTNKNIETGYIENSPKFKTVKTIDNQWEISFKNKQIAPKPIKTSTLKDWTLSDNNLLKHYSGTATYKNTFQFNKVKGDEIYIDLGKVGVMATVTLNGQNMGTTWIQPYQLDITDALKQGENKIEIEVVNVWRNRITGDKQLPKEERYTWLLYDNVAPEEELITSGLLGPVTLQLMQ